MENKSEDIEFSDHIREIMGHPPSAITRWGNTIILIVILIFIFFMWIIKYPDRIEAPVEITTTTPPVTMVSKITGRIKGLYVNDKDHVNAGQLLAVMESTASMDQINTLRLITDTLSDPAQLYLSAPSGFDELGEIQNYWGLFQKSMSDYNTYLQNDFYGTKIKSLSQEIDGIKAYIGKIRVKENLYTENRDIEEKKYKRDSLLYSTGVYSESELEKSYQSLLGLNIDLQQVRLDHSAKAIELAEKQQLLEDYRIKRIEDKMRYYSALTESLLNLKAQLKIWENTFTLVSPVTGSVTFTRYWSQNQTVIVDEPVLSIIPDKSGDYIGRINLKMQRSGKVKTGQTVNIKLSSYPYLEYGMVKGIVGSKSLVPSEGSYIIELKLPSGLTTLYGEKLEFTQNMQGFAEIITENTRLLQKIINPFRYLVSRNRSLSTSLNKAHNHLP